MEDQHMQCIKFPMPRGSVKDDLHSCVTATYTGADGGAAAVDFRFAVLALWSLASVWANLERSRMAGPFQEKTYTGMTTSMPMQASLVTGGQFKAPTR